MGLLICNQSVIKSSGGFVSGETHFGVIDSKARQQEQQQEIKRRSALHQRKAELLGEPKVVKFTKCITSALTILAANAVPQSD